MSNGSFEGRTGTWPDSAAFVRLRPVVALQLDPLEPECDISTTTGIDLKNRYGGKFKRVTLIPGALQLPDVSNLWKKPWIDQKLISVMHNQFPAFVPPGSDLRPEPSITRGLRVVSVAVLKGLY